MNKPVKILYFVDRMRRGGIQSLVIDWVSRFDKNRIHVDFLLLDDGNKYSFYETFSLTKSNATDRLKVKVLYNNVQYTNELEKVES